MGVHGLWNIIDSVGHPVKVTALEGKRLGVDANIWLYKFIRGFREKDNASSIESHKLGLFNRICKLLANKIKPVFVFDGPAPVLKRKTLERRENVRNKHLDKLQDAAMRLLAQQIKDQYPEAKVDDIAIRLPTLKSHALVAAEKLTDEDKELFYLPPEVVQVESDDDDDNPVTVDKKPDLRQGEFNEQVYYDEEPDVDIQSAEFESMPAEIRYEILKDIKDSRRRLRRREALPEDANDFSKLQLQRLKEKRMVQEKIEKCERDICSMYTGEIGGKSVLTYRMQSDSTSYINYVTYTDKKPVTTEQVSVSGAAKDDKPKPESSQVEKVSTPERPGPTLERKSPENKRVQYDSEPEDADAGSPAKKTNIDHHQEVKLDDITIQLSPAESEAEDKVENVTIQLSTPGSHFQTKISDLTIQLSSPESHGSILAELTDSDSDSSSEKPEVIELESEEDDIILSTAEEEPKIQQEQSVEQTKDQDVEAESHVNINPTTSEILDEPISEPPPREDWPEDVDDLSFLEKERSLKSKGTVQEIEIDGETEKSETDIGAKNTEEPKDQPANTEQSQPEATTYVQSQSQSQSQPKIANNATTRVSNKIVEEAKELLRLFGIPYIDAAGEAEAQCALLESLKLTEGTITDDSDVWLFGSQNVYRHFFNDDNYITHYKMKDIEFHVRLNRENLVCFAMLVGSDYTDGIMNVGPVTALEILSEFQGDSIEPLVKFKEWREKCSRTKNLRPGTKKRQSFLKFKLPEDFPSRVVFEGYMRPMADSSTEQFVWGMPELDELREYARRNFAWDSNKIDDRLLPVMKKLSERKTQTTIDTFFFKTPANQDPERFRSKRVNQALSKIAKTGESEEVALSEDDDELDDEEKEKEKEVEAASKKKVGGRGRQVERKRAPESGRSGKGKQQVAETARGKKKAAGKAASSAKRIRKTQAK